MTPPNYFRFVKHASSGGDPYDGYTLQEDESFQTAGWGIANYSAAGFSSQEDISFESGSISGANPAFDVDNTQWWT